MDGVFDENSITRAFRKEEKSQAKGSNSENSSFAIVELVHVAILRERQPLVGGKKKKLNFWYCLCKKKLFGCI